MWQQQGDGQQFNYWQQYVTPPQVPANVPATVTKPGDSSNEWAAKAAQWAQQRQLMEQQQQIQQQYYQQQQQPIIYQQHQAAIYPSPSQTSYYSQVQQTTSHVPQPPYPSHSYSTQPPSHFPQHPSHPSHPPSHPLQPSSHPLQPSSHPQHPPSGFPQPSSHPPHATSQPPHATSQPLQFPSHPPSHLPQHPSHPQHPPVYPQTQSYPTYPEAYGRHGPPNEQYWQPPIPPFSSYQSTNFNTPPKSYDGHQQSQYQNVPNPASQQHTSWKIPSQGPESLLKEDQQYNNRQQSSSVSNPLHSTASFSYQGQQSTDCLSNKSLTEHSLPVKLVDKSQMSSGDATETSTHSETFGDVIAQKTSHLLSQDNTNLVDKPVQSQDNTDKRTRSRSIPGLDLLSPESSNPNITEDTGIAVTVSSSSTVTSSITAPTHNNVHTSEESAPKDATKMLQSLGKIVTQLQVLQGLKKPEMSETHSQQTDTQSINIQEVESDVQQDDTTKKMAALLENESDSDEESSNRMNTKETSKQTELYPSPSEYAEYRRQFTETPSHVPPHTDHRSAGDKHHDFLHASTGRNQFDKTPMDRYSYSEEGYPPTVHSNEPHTDRKGGPFWRDDRVPYSDEYSSHYVRTPHEAPSDYPRRAGYEERPFTRDPEWQSQSSYEEKGYREYWSEQSVQPVHPPSDSNIDSYDYGHGYSSILSNIQSVDYGHGRNKEPTIPSHHDVPYPQHDQSYMAPPYREQMIASSSSLDYSAEAFVPYQQQQQSSLPPMVNYALAQLQQKGLPKWLKEELERLEKKKVKDMERSIQESSKQDERKHPRWKDEVDEPEETGEYETQKRRSHSPHYRKRSLSQSPTRNEETKHRRIKDSDDEEEKQFDVITKVRQTLTEILLEVTTAEMKVLAREALEEYSGGAKDHSIERNTLGLDELYGSDSDVDDTPHPMKEKESSPILDPDQVTATFKGEIICSYQPPKQEVGKLKRKSSKWDSVSRDISETVSPKSTLERRDSERSFHSSSSNKNFSKSHRDDKHYRHHSSDERKSSEKTKSSSKSSSKTDKHYEKEHQEKREDKVVTPQRILTNELSRKSSSSSQSSKDGYDKEKKQSQYRSKSPSRSHRHHHHSPSSKKSSRHDKRNKLSDEDSDKLSRHRHR